jgi:hypothetical protein
MPEVIQSEYLFAENGYSLVISIFGWDGAQLANQIVGDLAEDDPFFVEGWLHGGQATIAYGSYVLQDVYRNGTKAVVITNGFLRGQTCLLLYRETKMVLAWNGQGYVGSYLRTPAKYRIQAVWDGDDVTLHGRYIDALADYEKAIDDSAFLAWSPAYRTLIFPLCPGTDGSTPVPKDASPDQNELPRLSAYSLYRIMLLQAAYGSRTQAQVAHNTLQKSHFVQGKAGSEYLDLAESFWSAYANSGNISQACQQAVAYASLHAEQILAPLGRSIYGGDYRPYVPEDVCPFR